MMRAAIVADHHRKNNRLRTSIYKFNAACIHNICEMMIESMIG